MAAGVSAALFNSEENRQAGPNFKVLWRKMETKSEFFGVLFSGRLCPLLKFNQLQHTHSSELLTVKKVSTWMESWLTWHSLHSIG